MAFNKIAIMSHQSSVKALNKPTGSGWDIFNLPNLIKTASITSEKEDLGGFDIKTAIKEHPDFLYVKIFAIKKDEPNDNGDAFNEEELEKSAETFIGVPLFTNHQNDDVEKARGECVHAWYDKKEGGIYIIGRVDKVAYPRLARGIEQKYVSGTSMGCSVSHSLCSVCHKMARVASDYCGHVKNGKSRKFSGTIKCSYHDSDFDDIQEKCPLCGSTKHDKKSIKHSEQLVYEHNYGLKFIENSFVVNPACHDCGVKCVLNIPDIQKKVASLSNAVDHLIKNSSDPEFFENNAENLVKMGGVKELQSLKGSMSEMENVVKSMLMQKENVSMEYVSDLVKAMSEVQGIYDELIEMGYGALPSPAITQGATETPISEFPRPVPMQPQPQAQAPEPSGDVSSSDMGGLGTITLPKKSSKNKEDFLTNHINIMNKVSSLDKSIRDLVNNSNSQLRMGAKMIIEPKNTKTAAGAENQEVITEKQLAKGDNLHPRTDTTYEAITESKEQLGGEEKSNDTTSDSPQVRTGTYETITEDQLKSKSALGNAVIHFNEYPDVITEKQWNEFSKEIASNVSPDYTEQITQAQIRDLLDKHKFIGDVETITEDQLKNISMTDGLKRWANTSYSVALLKTASEVVADLISSYKKSPDEIRKIVSSLQDDASLRSKISFLSIINSLPNKKDSRVSLASKSRYFSKVSSSDSVSDYDSVILAVANHAQLGQKVEDVLDFVGNVVNNKQAMEKVHQIVKSMNNVDNDTVYNKVDAFGEALKVSGRPEDGKYRIKATIEEAGIDLSNKVACFNGIKKYAQEMIDDAGVAAAVIKIEVGENGELVIDVQDTNMGAADEITPDDLGEIIEGPIEEIDADTNGEGEEGPEAPEGLEEVAEEEKPAADPEEEGVEEEKEVSAIPQGSSPAMAAAKKEIKTAQMMGGEMGGQGGASQGAGAGATLPSAPAAATPPMENFTNDEAGDAGMEDSDDTSEPMPPGSICPVCGSEDVDIVAGKGKCNSCNSEMTYKVEINVTKWQGVTPDEEGAAGEEGEFSGEGFEMPTEEEMGGAAGAPGAAGAGAGAPGAEMPAVAAFTRLKPEALKKIASMKIELGSVSPANGKTNTVKLANGEYVCLDTGTRYKVSFVVSPQDTKKGAYAQWEWTPRVAGSDCPSCIRMKKNFVKALSSVNIKKADFDAMDIKKQVETIVQLKKAGNLETIKTANKNSSVTGDFKLAYGNWGDKFPIESCIEKIARRFGENAVCLSGPDEGKPLAISICNRLKKADVYSNKVAIKLAEAWSDCDGDEECITHQVRSGYELREAASICSSLKSIYAQAEDFLADEMSDADTMAPEAPVDGAGEDGMDDGMSDGMDDVDPFAGEGDMGAGTVTLELPKEVVEQLDAKLDEALGENPAEEDHHNDELAPEGDVTTPEGDIAPIGDDAGAPPVEQITPEDLASGKPATDVPVAGGDPTAAKPCTEFEAELPGGCGDLGGDNDDPNKPSGGGSGGGKVTIKVNGEPTDGVAAEEETDNDNGFNEIEASLMNGAIGKVGKPQMDLSKVIASLKKADKNISQEKAQDSKDIGTYTGGENAGKMGHENETIPTAAKPSVPRNLATMGQEPSDLNPQDKPQPTIPSGDATMGHEKEVGLSGGDARYTGGDKGQGKVETASSDEDLYHMRGFRSSKKGLSNLADRISAKLAPKEPVAKDKDIQPISGDSKIGKEEEIKAVEINEGDVKSDSGFIGHEKETLENKPDSPKDHPEVFTGKAQMGKEELDSEKTTKDKGTVIAHSNSESEAFRVAARMLQNKKIEASDLQQKINELKRYQPEQIKDIERSIFAHKGLDTVSDGLSQPVQINETSSVKNASDDLAKQLQGMFTLGKQNQWAEGDENTQIRMAFNK